MNKHETLYTTDTGGKQCGVTVNDMALSPTQSLLALDYLYKIRRADYGYIQPKYPIQSAIIINTSWTGDI